MAGKASRSGRKPGAKTNWRKNVTALCRDWFNIRIEEWLVKVSAFASKPTRTVPPKFKRALAERAILEVLAGIDLEEDVLTIYEVVRLLLLDDDDPELRRTPGVVAVDVDAVLAGARRQAPKGPTLRRKVRQRPDPDDPYSQYLDRISNAWRSP
jgi:hypothetical protein